MFDRWRRAAAVLDRQTDRSSSAPPARVSPFTVGDGRDAVQEAVAIIQTHVDREARNRRVRELAPRDLCPMQKAELVKDLTRVLR